MIIYITVEEVTREREYRVEHVISEPAFNHLPESALRQLISDMKRQLQAEIQAEGDES